MKVTTHNLRRVLDALTVLERMIVRAESEIASGGRSSENTHRLTWHLRACWRYHCGAYMDSSVDDANWSHVAMELGNRLAGLDRAKKPERMKIGEAMRSFRVSVSVTRANIAAGL